MSLTFSLTVATLSEGPWLHNLIQFIISHVSVTHSHDLPRPLPGTFDPNFPHKHAQ